MDGMSPEYDMQDPGWWTRGVSGVVYGLCTMVRMPPIRKPLETHERMSRHVSACAMSEGWGYRR